MMKTITTMEERYGEENPHCSGKLLLDVVYPEVGVPDGGARLNFFQIASYVLFDHVGSASITGFTTAIEHHPSMDLRVCPPERLTYGEKMATIFRENVKIAGVSHSLVHGICNDTSLKRLAHWCFVLPWRRSLRRCRMPFWRPRLSKRSN